MSQLLKIDVVSDFVCPWCYVGKKRLEAALTLLPHVNAQVNWLPFQLSPDMPREGRRRIDHYREIFGEQRAEQIMANMRDTGTEEGISFGSSPDAMSPNTLAAHALLLAASEEPHVDIDALVEALFRAHHVDCADIGDIEVLVRLAIDAGMDEDAARSRLSNRADEGNVENMIRENAARGVSGVPFFVINDRYGISGAQPADTLVDAFKQIVSESGERRD